MTISTQTLSQQFPVLEPALDGSRTVYLDSAATAQTPQVVVDSLIEYYTRYRANVHRAVYPLAVEATERFEQARAKVAEFAGASSAETIFTRNATESINLVAYSWGRANVKRGDVIVVTEMEHHSNLVPWQQLAAEVDAELAYVPIDDEGLLQLDVLDRLLERKPKLVAVAHISNVLGTVNPIEEIVRRAHRVGAIVVVDGAQAVPHIPVDFHSLGADFYAWTGHKLYGPTGVGVLHGRRELLEVMPPFLTGGHMISRVGKTASKWADPPSKFEAGTSAIAAAIALGTATDYVREVGLDEIGRHGRELMTYALQRFDEESDLTLYGPRNLDLRAPICSFTLAGAHPHDIAEILAREGVCVRAGHHCAQVLMRRLDVSSLTRASFALYNTVQDVDALFDGLGSVRRTLRL